MRAIKIYLSPVPHTSPEVVQMPDDLFAQLDAELNELAEDITDDMGKLSERKAAINKSLIENFWKIWIRFDKRKIHFTMEPSPGTFATFEEFPDKWSFRDNFRFADCSSISLIDKTQDQGRTGDSLKAWYYPVGKEVHFRLVFEYCEGEHYYKYSGWKRIFAQQILYDSPVDKVNLNKIWEILAGLVKVWFESHLRRNRELLLKYVRENFEKGETFTQ